ncbi:THUMP domain-containing protein 2 [Merluccius polli]|uniref:THUMP domain-containing protein 2 n=1 Tax=Merluccius polli TaxID=89951 RepID=A0AA47MVM2_MERPO|nr:THUMP domain-containing protein 2 [Merluccius polli]
MEGCGVSAGPGPDAMEGCGVSAGPGPDAMEGCRVSAGPGPSADAMERCGVSAGPGADATERSGVSPGPGPGPGAGGRTYFCTAGGGLEDLLAEELHTRLGAEDVCHVSGKVLFRTSAGMDALRRLKSAERLFLLVSREAPVALPAHTCPVKAASLLQASLLGDGSQWADAAVTWSRLQGETESWGSDMQQAAGAPRQQRKTDASGEEGRRGREEGCDGGVRRRGGEVSADGRRRECEGEEGSDGVNEEQKCGKKRKRVGDELDGGGGQGEGMERQMEQLTSPPPPPPPGVPSPPQRVTFRVNCKLSGPLSRCLTSQDLGRVIGSGLCRLMGWKVELRSPQLEVNVYLSGDHSILGIPLTRLPLASRSYMRSTGLRSTVAWALGSLASIQPGWCVLDPMCGVGTILLEAAQEHKDVHFLGVDIDDGQLQRANENVTFADLRDRIHLMKASCSGLPVSSSSVDAVVCDVPFGRKFNTKTNMADSLRCIVSEMERWFCVQVVPWFSFSVLRCHAPPGPSTQPPQEPQLQAPPGPSTQPPQEPQLQAPPGPSTQPPQEPQLQAGPQPAPPPPLSALQLQSTHRVRLGAIDGLIHSYVKIKT